MIIFVPDGLGSAMVDKAVLTKVIEECSQAEAGEDSENVFNVINTFDAPRFHYRSAQLLFQQDMYSKIHNVTYFPFSKDRKKYLPDPPGKCSVYPDADKKADVFRLRYETIHQVF